MISITIQVTAGPKTLKQIHHIGIQNVTKLEPSVLPEYEVTIDGKTLPLVINMYHGEDELELIYRALGVYFEWRRV